MDIKGKKVLVLGMKISGVPACYLLKRKEAIVTYYDDNVSPLNGEFINVTNLSIDEIFSDLYLIVTSPGFSSKHKILAEAAKRNIKVISELELGYRYINAPIIGVTGTNGKTTTVNMLHKILSLMGFSVVKAGNVGYPLTQVVIDVGKYDYVIVEASSFQLDYIDSFRCNIAILMNIAPDHMDRYDTFQDYVKAKKRIFANQDFCDFALVNNDDLCAAAAAEDDIKSNIIFFGVKNGNSRIYIKDNYYMFEDKTICHVKESKAKGEHNKYNLLATMNAAALLGAKREHCLNLIKDYVPLAHRIEYVATIGGKTFYNDSKGTNIHATKFAVASVEGTVGLIMGGSDKNEDYCEFFEGLDPRVKYIAVTGSNADKILSSAMKMGYTSISAQDDLASCIEKLNKSDVDTVLFSPSAASFDRYHDYAERGETFKRMVYEIKS